MTLQELADALGGEIRGHGKAAFVFVKRGSKAAELWPHEDGSWWIDTWNGDDPRSHNGVLNPVEWINLWMDESGGA